MARINYPYNSPLTFLLLCSQSFSGAMMASATKTQGCKAYLKSPYLRFDGAKYRYFVDIQLTNIEVSTGPSITTKDILDEVLPLSNFLAVGPLNTAPLLHSPCKQNTLCVTIDLGLHTLSVWCQRAHWWSHAIELWSPYCARPSM